jgi:hypothetical protein
MQAGRGLQNRDEKLNVPVSTTAVLCKSGSNGNRGYGRHSIRRAYLAASNVLGRLETLGLDEARELPSI